MMRQLTYFVAASLDGRIAGPDGSFDFFPLDPAYLADLAAEWGDGFPTAFHQAFGSEPPHTKFDTVLMGRHTFEPAVQAGVVDPYAHLDTYVYSSTLDPAEHPQVHVVRTDPSAHVRELKASSGGGIWLCGGGRLAASLYSEIDRLVIKLNPLTLGAGRQLFEGPFVPQQWRLTSHRPFDIGVVLLEYSRVTGHEDRPAGTTTT
jgi:dihydrofolate reductase